MRKEDAQIGNRVSWIGWKNFGTVPHRCTGTIESVNCGVPYYKEPPEYVEYEGQSYPREAGRHPAALIRPDGEIDPIAGPLVIKFEDLTLIEEHGQGQT